MRGPCLAKACIRLATCKAPSHSTSDCGCFSAAANFVVPCVLLTLLYRMQADSVRQSCANYLAISCHNTIWIHSLFCFNLILLLFVHTLSVCVMEAMLTWMNHVAAIWFAWCFFSIEGLEFLLPRHDSGVHFCYFKHSRSVKNRLLYINTFITILFLMRGCSDVCLCFAQTKRSQNMFRASHPKIAFTTLKRQFLAHESIINIFSLVDEGVISVSSFVVGIII